MPDRIKKNPNQLPEGLRLHYFPNIPVNQAVNAGGRVANESGFQRSHFKSIDSTGRNDDPAIGSAGTSPEPNGSWVEEIKADAFQKGYDEGKRAGLESGTQKADPVISSLNQALVQLENIRRQVHQEIEEEVARLALSIARKIICHEVKTHPETVVCVAREALSRVQDPGKIKIKLNPDDLQFIQDTQSQLSHFLHNVDEVRFESEDSIQSGGCLIETDRGDIDARIEKQLQAIEEAFQAQFEKPVQEN